MKKIYCDSSVREACVVIDGETHIMPYGSNPNFTVTNNEGEYKAVLWAIGFACAMDGDITILTDSKLVVEQANKRWKCKADNLKQHCREVQFYLALWQPRLKLEWVSREENPAGKVLGGR